MMGNSYAIDNVSQTNRINRNGNGQITVVSNLGNDLIQNGSILSNSVSRSTRRVRVSNSLADGGEADKVNQNNNIRQRRGRVSTNGPAPVNQGTGHTSLGKGQLNGLNGLNGLSRVATYIRQNLDHRSGAATTAAGVESTGFGDCWGLAAWAAQVFHQNGYKVRLLQGPTAYASNHRWVEVLVNGGWVSFDPSAVTPRYNSVFGYAAKWASWGTVIATY